MNAQRKKVERQLGKLIKRRVTVPELKHLLKQDSTGIEKRIAARVLLNRLTGHAAK